MKHEESMFKQCMLRNPLENEILNGPEFDVRPKM